MEYVIYVVKYGALVVLGVNVVLIGRALVTMVLEKARAAQSAPAAAQE